MCECYSNFLRLEFHCLFMANIGPTPGITQNTSRGSAEPRKRSRGHQTQMASHEFVRGLAVAMLPPALG